MCTFLLMRMESHYRRREFRRQRARPWLALLLPLYAVAALWSEPLHGAAAWHSDSVHEEAVEVCAPLMSKVPLDPESHQHESDCEGCASSWVKLPELVAKVPSLAPVLSLPLLTSPLVSLGSAPLALANPRGPPAR
jgi:hypothetical protein